MGIFLFFPFKKKKNHFILNFKANAEFWHAGVVVWQFESTLFEQKLN